MGFGRNTSGFQSKLSDSQTELVFWGRTQTSQAVKELKEETQVGVRRRKLTGFLTKWALKRSATDERNLLRQPLEDL
ncbi:hypothetical protein QJS10_CPB04g00612 [Acorus calamus]|uniref:Uncharacterized protein n=1 Tax=Acorus calamus TaxID=4465 RepID=A0AAV9F0Z8_ACOCL|nr:hypothetical protein QJS10_CPB04g00612 [Acorus calamus]